MTDHEDAQERLSRANIDDARQRASDRVEEDAEEAREVVVEDARLAAAALTGEVATLREEITVLQKIDNFKGKVFVVGIVVSSMVVLAFAGLWWVSNDVDNGVRAIRTDLEVHRIRNEASHDCIAEKLAQLPPPEARTDVELAERFVQEFLGCVTKVAPTIVPPKVPDIRGKGAS